MVTKEGQIDKLGCFVFADGDRYDGGFRRGAMHGHGVYYWKNDGSTYFGEWDDNAQQGCGVKFYGNGAIEWGEWKDDQFLASFTGVCGETQSYGSMNNALDVAQRARMFKYKPDSEVTMQLRAFTPYQDPVVYQEGTEWQMPGWRGELYEAPSYEDLKEQHPRLLSQMQRHNEIWERSWRYYNMDYEGEMAAREARGIDPDSLSNAEKRGDDEEDPEKLAAEARAAIELKMRQAEEEDDYDEYASADSKPKKGGKDKKGKGKKKGKGGGSAAASLTLSLRNAGTAVERAFAAASRLASRRPEIAAFAERRRARAERRRAEEAHETRRKVGPFASLSMSLPFAR